MNEKSNFSGVSKDSLNSNIWNVFIFTSLLNEVTHLPTWEIFFYVHAHSFSMEKEVRMMELQLDN